MTLIALSAESLTVRRGDRQLFSGLGFALAAGEALSLVGANGAGKTSLLRTLAGFIAPAEGTVSFEGSSGPLDAEDARRSDIHLLGHQDGLKTARTAAEELAFQVRWTGGDAAGARAAAETLNLTRLMDLEVRKLSAGQRRRLALARIIASPRALWLLDEPMAPLDAAHRALFADLIGRHLAAGGLVIAAVHDPLPIPTRTLELAG